MKYTKGNPLSASLPRDKFIELYHEKNFLIKDIASLYETSVDAVTRLRRVYKIERKDNQVRSTASSGKPNGKLQENTTPDKMKDLYWEKNWSMQEIADHFEVTRGAVYLYFKRHEIPRRNKSQSRRLAKVRGKLPQHVHTINDSIFDGWSDEMSWLLGYLFVKGLISGERDGSRKILTIINQDNSELTYIQSILKSSHPLIEFWQADSISYRFEVANVKLVERLLQFGVSQNRYERGLREDVPEKYRLCFLSGLFCAGGEFSGMHYVDDEGGQNLRIASFRHPSLKLMEQISPYIEELGLRESGISRKERNKALAQLEFYDEEHDRLKSVLQSVEIGRDLLPT